jgi:membrane-associated protein
MAVDPLSLHSITQWASPDFLVGKFGVALFWIGILLLFIECGLFFPFLPGDTLLFAMGLFIADKRVDLIPGGKGLDLLFALVIYTLAAFAGNVIGYEIGYKIGPRVYERDGRIIQRKYLDQTSEFFEKHGSPALVIGRFVPVVRTYITLVAGVTRMPRRRFLEWSAIGAVLWVLAITLLGYFLGAAFPSIGSKIDLITYGLLAVTVVGIAVEFLRKRGEKDPGVPEAYRAEYDTENAADKD